MSKSTKNCNNETLKDETVSISLGEMRFDYFKKYIDFTKLPINYVINDKSIQFSYGKHFIQIVIEDGGYFHIYSTSMQLDIEMHIKTQECIVEEYLVPFVDIVIADTISKKMYNEKIQLETLLAERDRMIEKKDNHKKERRCIVDEYEARLKIIDNEINECDNEIAKHNYDIVKIESDEKLLALVHRSITQKIKNNENK